MLVYLFSILGFLFSLEASTALSRKAGYFYGKPEAGFVLQSSLSLFSRILVFMFMPILGFTADNFSLEIQVNELVVATLIPLFILALYVGRNFVTKFYFVLISRVMEHGSFFIKSSDQIVFLDIKRTLKLESRFYRLYIIVFISFIPYYLSWPLIIFLLSEFPEYRATLMGLSSLLTGVNTILLTLFVDPMLMKIGRYQRVVRVLYDKLVLVRLVSSCVAMLLFFMLIAFWTIYE